MMSLDLLFTGLVVGIACYYVVRKLLGSGGSCSGGCGCSSEKNDNEISDFRKKDK